MIKLNVQVGADPFANHKVINVFSHPALQHSYSIGKNGQIVAWKQQKPIFLMFPSVHGQAQKCKAIDVLKLRNIQQSRQQVLVVTLHNDNRIRFWADDDGMCLLVSYPGLSCSPKQGHFVVVLGIHQFWIYDVWTNKVKQKIEPVKDSFVEFESSRINDFFQLQIISATGRQYTFDTSRIFGEYFLDYGNLIVNSQKIDKQFKQICELISKKQLVCSFVSKPQYLKNNIVVQQYNKYIEQHKHTLLQQIFHPFYIQNYQLGYFNNQIAAVSSLNFIGCSLYLLVGTKSGIIFIIPYSLKKYQNLSIIMDDRHKGSCVKYLKILGNNIFISWQNGLFGVYCLSSFTSILQIAKINHQNQQIVNKQNGTKKQPIIGDLSKIITIQILLGNYVKKRLKAYQGQAHVHGSQFFKLKGNEFIRFNQPHIQNGKVSQPSITTWKGMSTSARIYCIYVNQQYTCLCTEEGVQVFSPFGYERTINIEDWQWSDYQFIIAEKRMMVQNNFDNNVIKIFKQNYKWILQNADYNTDNLILSQTLPRDQQKLLFNKECNFGQFYFWEKQVVRQTIHSLNSDVSSSVIKFKTDTLREDTWNNTIYIFHGDFNSQIQQINTQKIHPKQTISKNYQFYSLMGCDDLPSPFITKQLRQIGTKIVIKCRHTVQGSGKSFTIYYPDKKRINWSQRRLAVDGVSTVSLIQSWITRQPQNTDHMVESVQYFSKLIQSLYEDRGVSVLAALAISPSVHISKSAINIMISLAHLGKYPLHPTLEYFLLFRQNKIQFNAVEAVWLLYLGLALLYSGKNIEKQKIKIVVYRIIQLMMNQNNYTSQPHLILAVMRIFNQGVSTWRNLIQNSVPDLFRQLLKSFYSLEAQAQNSIRKTVRQGIIKTIVYLGRQFPAMWQSVLRIQSTNQKINPSYPSSVIQVLRQFIKAQKPQQHIVFYVQLLLQCLSPMTPQLRKHVQKSALNTLQLLCTYNNVSFNQHSQKLSVKTHNHLYIYCLRTSTKWRTINIKDEHQHPRPQVQISPRGTFVALLDFKLRIWKLSSGFWSGVLGAFSQDISYDITGLQIKWAQDESGLTVINQNPALNKFIKI